MLRCSARFNIIHVQDDSPPEGKRDTGHLPGLQGQDPAFTGCIPRWNTQPVSGPPASSSYQRHQLPGARHFLYGFPDSVARKVYIPPLCAGRVQP